jgi:hypothetical protein
MSAVNNPFDQMLARADAAVAAANATNPTNARVGAQKFTKSTKAYAKLKKMFEDKLILPTDGAKEIRQRDPLFMDFTHNQFRSQFNNLRREMGTTTREGKQCDTLALALMNSMK